jgi:hypothetical protein
VAIARVRLAADAVISMLGDGLETPNAIDLEFGMLTAEVGAAIARTRGEVHLRLTLRWARE